MKRKKDAVDRLFAKHYEVAADDGGAAVFGEHYREPVRFEHGVAQCVAVYKKAGGDGQEVQVLETRMPARFYTISAFPDRNSGGEPVRGWVMSTGSGDAMAELAHKMALAASQGMLGFDDEQCRKAATVR